MDTPEYTTLAAPLKGVPDPRQRRGQHYPWSLLIMAALVSGERHGALASGCRNTLPSWGTGWAGRVPGSRVRRPCVELYTNWTWGCWKTP